MTKFIGLLPYEEEQVQDLLDRWEDTPVQLTLQRQPTLSIEEFLSRDIEATTYAPVVIEQFRVTAGALQTITSKLARIFA